ncbi:ABC transporter substrate-binding protein [Desulfobacterales bacterium HSG16]|nr:ABC transporter substrate-binding protein [Desulfobacterales bacterium HSG16]
MRTNLLNFVYSCSYSAAGMAVFIFLLSGLSGTAFGITPETVEETDIFNMVHSSEWDAHESLDPTSPTRFLPPIMLLYERLVRPDKNGNPSPCLAKSWMYDETGKKFTFKIRKNIRFHNGKPLTAHDVVYTFKHILDPDFDSPAAPALNIIDTRKFATPDTHTVIFSLKKPHFDFPVLLMHYMVRIIAEGSAETTAKSGNGTGPFKLIELDPRGVTKLAANEDYWGGKPRLKRIDVISMAGKDIQVNALLENKIDYVNGISYSQAHIIKENKNFTIQEAHASAWHGLVMNTSVSPFDDLRVRKAMKLVMDSEKMVSMILRGHGMPAYNNPVSPSDRYYMKLDTKPDIDKAKSLLALAGYPNGMNIELYVTDDDPFLTPIATAYAKMAEPAGIRIKINLMKPEKYWNSIWMKAPFHGTDWFERFADQILNEAFVSGAIWNDTFWSNPEFDQLLVNARMEKDFEKRKLWYHKAQKLVAEQGGAIIPFFPNSIRAFANTVYGIDPDYGDHNINWANVYKNSF